MAKIRHIALTAADPSATADFYKTAFDLTEVRRAPDDEAVILSDGYITMAILKFKTDSYGGGRPGLHHFGFLVDEMDETETKLSDLGGTENVEWNDLNGNREGDKSRWIGEKKWLAPDGVAFDINPTGWQTAPQECNT